LNGSCNNSIMVSSWLPCSCVHFKGFMVSSWCPASCVHSGTHPPPSTWPSKQQLQGGAAAAVQVMLTTCTTACHMLHTDRLKECRHRKECKSRQP
jgi:hypothetical protein